MFHKKSLQQGFIKRYLKKYIPEAVEAMLASVRLGAIHSVVFGGDSTNQKWPNYSCLRNTM